MPTSCHSTSESVAPNYGSCNGNRNHHIVDIGKSSTIDDYEPILSDDDYCCDGLSLEELLPYQHDPWWQMLRRTMLYSVGFTVLLTFLTAILISYLHADNSCKLLIPIGSSDLALEMTTKAAKIMP